ncbi:MAG: hypothetical protein AAGD04_15225 [Pseudomonadota bacterium]
MARKMHLVSKDERKNIKAISFEDYMERTKGKALVLNFQPKFVTRVETTKQLKEWEDVLREEVGFSALGITRDDIEEELKDHNHTNTWCVADIIGKNDMYVCDEDCDP